MNKLYHACVPFLITIVDHLILTDNTYASFIENEYMELIFLSDMYKSYIEIEPKIIRDKENAERIGEERGREMGLVEGKEVGRDEGLIQGKRDMAKKMLLKNKPIEEILEFTGLTAEDIVKIKDILNIKK